MMRGRLMVGRQALDLEVEVRVLTPQQDYSSRTDYFEILCDFIHFSNFIGIMKGKLENIRYKKQ